MEWYWWLLIALGVVGLGALKLLVFNKMRKKKNKPTHKGED
ncbi:MAG: hypothetical protein PHI19_03675 [Clostridia bacterium]|nr:hypothetical protein [Clostridia bacterium]